ncbi:hypothetical protein GOODEAATRI_012309, partial [Goodea atripinnis]
TGLNIKPQRRSGVSSKVTLCISTAGQHRYGPTCSRHFQLLQVHGSHVDPLTSRQRYRNVKTKRIPLVWCYPSWGVYFTTRRRPELPFASSLWDFPTYPLNLDVCERGESVARKQGLTQTDLIVLIVSVETSMQELPHPLQKITNVSLITLRRAV